MFCRCFSTSDSIVVAVHKGATTQRPGDTPVRLTPRPAISALLLPVQLRSVALMYREDESKFLNWAKDVGLLRLQQYQDFLRQWVWHSLASVSEAAQMSACDCVSSDPRSTIQESRFRRHL
jgi:hypothetical protein